MKRYFLAGIALLIAGVLQAAPPVPVEAVTAAREPIVETIRVTGTVVARRSASLSPAVAGLVTAYRVEAGDRVQTGDELLSLDAEVAVHVRERADAERREIGARLSDARRRLAEAREPPARAILPGMSARAVLHLDTGRSAWKFRGQFTYSKFRGQFTYSVWRAASAEFTSHCCDRFPGLAAKLRFSGAFERSRSN